MRRAIALISAAAVVFGLATATALPAEAAAKPSVKQISFLTPRPAGGQNITLLGSNLNLVTTMTAGTRNAVIVAKSAKQLVFIAPRNLAGPANIVLSYSGGKVTLTAALIYRDGPERALVPLPYIPDTLKVGKTFSMKPGDPAWVVSVKSLTTKTCTVSGLIVKGKAKGDCVLQFSITVDSASRTYRSRDAVWDLVIN